jgi:hypothetical protein
LEKLIRKIRLAAKPRRQLLSRPASTSALRRTALRRKLAAAQRMMRLLPDGPAAKGFRPHVCRANFDNLDQHAIGQFKRGALAGKNRLGHNAFLFFEA